MDPRLADRGFLPTPDPLDRFPAGSGLEALDELGRDLPSLLLEPDFRDRARRWVIPVLPADAPHDWARLYYVRVGFLASGFVNQVGPGPSRTLPENLARPLTEVARRLGRPPILSYDGYALYNWRRFDPDGPIALGNIDTFQDFVHLYDEHWFILVHVEIEAKAGRMLAALGRAGGLDPADGPGWIEVVREVGASLWDGVATLRRIPEKMDPGLYYKTFRPYIRFFEGVVYEGVDSAPLDFRGETGAQSSVIPCAAAFFKIPHQPSLLIDHLADMRRFMPAEHRAVIEEVERLPDPRGRADRDAYNDALEALATFREIHLGYAHEYINRRVADPRGTGGTPYMQWLAQLIDETRAHRIG